jgi:hypothetical protein
MDFGRCHNGGERYAHQVWAKKKSGQAPKKSRAELTRMAAERGKREQQAKAMQEEEELRRAYEAERRRGKQDAAASYRETCLAEIDRAAEKGKKEVLVLMASSEGNGFHINPYHTGLIEELIRRLKKDKYLARQESEYSPRVGSDDPQGNHRYYYIKITW